MIKKRNIIIVKRFSIHAFCDIIGLTWNWTCVILDRVRAKLKILNTVVLFLISRISSRVLPRFEHYSSYLDGHFEVFECSGKLVLDTGVNGVNWVMFGSRQPYLWERFWGLSALRTIPSRSRPTSRGCSKYDRYGKNKKNKNFKNKSKLVRVKNLHLVNWSKWLKKKTTPKQLVLIRYIIGTCVPAIRINNNII